MALVWRPEGKRLLEKSRRLWENNIKMEPSSSGMGRQKLDCSCLE